MAGLYAASRGDDVEIYDLRGGMLVSISQYEPRTNRLAFKLYTLFEKLNLLSLYMPVCCRRFDTLFQRFSARIQGPAFLMLHTMHSRSLLLSSQPTSPLELSLILYTSDLRDSSTAPLNFTKSINLALSERGINAMRHSGNGNLLGSVLEETIPMHGRMIHGRKKTGELYQESQAYDVHGRVSPLVLESLYPSPDNLSSSEPLIGHDSTSVSSTPSSNFPTLNYVSTTSSLVWISRIT